MLKMLQDTCSMYIIITSDCKVQFFSEPTNTNKTWFAEIAGKNMCKLRLNVYYSRSLDWRTRGNLLPGILYVSFDFYSNRELDLSIIAPAFPAFHVQAANWGIYISKAFYNSHFWYWEGAWKQVQMEFFIAKFEGETAALIWSKSKCNSASTDPNENAKIREKHHHLMKDYFL